MVGHCVGVKATSRAVITCIIPSEVGAYFTQFEFGLGPEPKPLLKKVPNPKSVYVKPPGLGVYPNESGVVSHNNATLGFLGKPRLAEPQHVNAGVVSAAALVSVPVVVDGVVPEPVPGVWVLPLPSRWHVLQPALPRNRL